MRPSGFVQLADPGEPPFSSTKITPAAAGTDFRHPA
jgi:hypothetical protein